MRTILEKALNKHSLSESEIIFLLSLKGFKRLSAAADITRKKYKGRAVELRALIEISNICKKNCLYCGIRRGNFRLKRYAMTEEEIMSAARAAVKQGFKTIVLQSGESGGISFLNAVIKHIKRLGAAVTLSLGTFNKEHYAADRYLLRIETTDKRLFKKMHPDTDFAARAASIKNIKKSGLELGTGILVGLPGQTIKSIARDILFFKKIKAGMIGIGPFIPNPDTPLKNAAPRGAFDMALKVIAITRLLLPNANIPATTAMETLQKNGRIQALRGGANVIMPNVTPQKYKKLYALYPNKASLGAYKQAALALKKINRDAN